MHFGYEEYIRRVLKLTGSSLNEPNLNLNQKTVRRIIVAAGLGKENKKQVKAIQTFEYPYPNDLWQTDIMGKIFWKTRLLVR